MKKFRVDRRINVIFSLVDLSSVLSVCCVETTDCELLNKQNPTSDKVNQLTKNVAREKKEKNEL
ncbi:hypothetical protein T02_16326 [Trichinella nativa]|uniref:Uncharacterized protein n=1 Tax=Trichinella nativa TaxID=6335 RepID=A0A0V1LQ78_9BILA|nr:hypothetical protein T02_16326 [Trichinella nativa]